MSSTKYTLRVYGFLVKDDKVLISSEHFKGKHLFKFPGGGMEEGEGTKDALIREFDEELGLAVEVSQHVYTTDFYLNSFFDPAYQVMSIYYRVEAKESLSFETHPKGEIPKPGDSESFQWWEISDLNSEMFTFPTEAKAFEAFRTLFNY
ncbi:NUDIX domain-containing protein [Phaeocystidibacter marisrubri]|uniref:NUDIX domain-containing protein n=1 Tax=Phaeocystidibacter marisrubri TaxID=1577780 RepID=A0A6L3ZIB5_9FLAO|nr:NUDIX domain-containing protein [Phaeocystidibacter marisrubri]KAB2817363.1 NUDIX domain-containing protein [Phaeocystidibacter marisrubri]GGH75724.1 hypothetical protein GCM10011318_23040 [Phaeocystidibacter marisrubri]